MSPADFSIGGHKIGPNHPVFIIAEIGATHDGNVELATKMIEAAATTGVQAVKLQTVSPDHSYCKGTLSHEIFSKLSLSLEDHVRLKKVADACGVLLFTTPGDFPSFEINKAVGFDLVKISSGLMTNTPLIQACAGLGVPMIMSSGMAYLDEIGKSVRIAREAGAKDIAVLHCTSSYPAKDSDLNLPAMAQMRQALNAHVGYSDHTNDGVACLAAVAAGALLLEKHFCLSKELAGPDAEVACDPAAFTELVKSVRRVSAMLGGAGAKVPTASEFHGRTEYRRVVAACRAIRQGETIKPGDISMKRPPLGKSGLSPDYYHQVLGLKAARDIADDEPITLGMLAE